MKNNKKNRYETGKTNTTMDKELLKKYWKEKRDLIRKNQYFSLYGTLKGYEEFDFKSNTYGYQDSLIETIDNKIRELENND